MSRGEDCELLEILFHMKLDGFLFIALLSSVLPLLSSCILETGNFHTGLRMVGLGVGKNTGLMVHYIVRRKPGHWILTYQVSLLPGRQGK